MWHVCDVAYVVRVWGMHACVCDMDWGLCVDVDGGLDGTLDVDGGLGQRVSDVECEGMACEVAAGDGGGRGG